MMQKLFKWALLLAALALLVPSCLPTIEEDTRISCLPEGTPIMMRLDFGASDLMDMEVSTKAESSPADEERIHDLYVLIFCDGEGDGHSRGQKIYGRYFSYEHLKSTLSDLDNSSNEGWWVENRTIPDATHPENDINKTRGAVKISTKVCSSAKLVVIANIDNGVCKLGDQDGFGEDALAYLNSIQKWDDLEATQVKLTQNVVNRKDLFLMMGFPEEGGSLKLVNTGEMVWGTTSAGFNSDYTVFLHSVDAKVKFKVRINERNADGTVKNNYISAAKAVYWEVDNTPDRCYLFSEANGGNPPEGTVYFNTEQAYFEGTVTEDGVEWYVFTFYMLESRFAAKAHANSYHDREKQSKTPTEKHGYSGDHYQRDDDLFVENGEWIYALPNAPYVRFDLILTLTPAGISALGGTVSHALTSDTIYSVHLGDFSGAGVDDYNTFRSTCYTYEITIANSGSIYAEVKQDLENQPGQEGYLLLTDDEIVNADAHYEYHSITFTYDAETTPEKFSWYVKTPFTSKVGGGPQKGTYTVGGKDYPTYDPHDTDGTLLDYRWVKFAINEIDESRGYSTRRVAYPGDGQYDKTWGVEGNGNHGPWDVSAENPRPVLMDISQLIQYIFLQTDKEKASAGSSDFKTDSSTGDKVIRATIFIDEFYYETDPRDESVNPQPDPNLWRQFVNAQPREMHILSRTVQSRDRKSDVIESSHSVIQQSIQTIYNVFEPSLRSVWGCEHLDEIKYTTIDGNELGSAQENAAGNWKYWPDGCSDTKRSGANTDIGKENGRLNSAYIWGLYNAQNNSGSFLVDGEGKGKRYWKHFLKYEVDNRIPELRNDTDSDSYGDDGTTHKYHGMAWSCLTRNRDNNGNGRIDPEEVRWYMAASQQLAGIWVGTESLSTSARLYQPASGQWRAHVVSSTAMLVAWSEEGAGATDIKFDWSPGNPYYTWANEDAATVGESVRCIRNVGTYDEGGVVKDISYAPVTLLPDKYFTLERSDGGSISNYDNSEASYIFHFDRLNTKSIREFSPGELPYHDQMSLNNRVYVKMITQPLSQDMDLYSEQLGEINNKVTQAGVNNYCPPGYRFPNHTEFLLMELYLPNSYLSRDKDGNGYSGTKVFPTRTYYDRGYYGSLRSETAAWSTEKNKVGWIYSDKMHCSPYKQAVTRSRCVKDEDMTGVISGKIAIEGQEIYPGDLIPIDFKFSSTASAFTDATLTLWYKKNGFLTPYDLTSQLATPTGLQYKGVQYIRIPTLTDLGLSAEGLPFNNSLEDDDMAIEVEFTNLNSHTGGHKIPVKMVNPLDGICSITDAVDGNKIFPSDQNAISLRLHTNTHDLNLSGATLTLCYDSNEITVETIPALVGGNPAKTYTRSSINIPALASLTGITPSILNAGDKSVTLKATVSMTYPNTKNSGTETLTKEITQPLALSNPVIANYFTIADAASSKLYPGDSNHVSLSFESRGHNGSLSTASLKLMKGENEVADYSSSLTQPTTSAYTINNYEITIPSLSQSLALDDELRLVATVGNSDGLSRMVDITDLVLSNPVSGTLTADTYLYPVDDGSVTLNFTSAANTLNLASVDLALFNGDTQLTSFSIDNEDRPSGSSKIYSPSLTVAIPPLTTMGLTAGDLNPTLPLTLKATVSTGNNLSFTAQQAVTLRSHVASATIDFPSEYTADGVPVSASASLVTGKTATISTATLQYKTAGGSWTNYVTSLGSDVSSISNEKVYTKNIVGNDAFTSKSFLGTDYSYRLKVDCSDGTIVYSPVRSMEILRFSFYPQTDATDGKWGDSPSGLDFSRGDYVEAQITLYQNKGKDGLISISATNDIDDFNAPNVFHFYLHETKSTPPNLRITAAYNGSKFIDRQNKTYGRETLNMRFDQNGLFIENVEAYGLWNVNDTKYRNLVTYISGQTSITIGQKEGGNRSYSTYQYIRVIRNCEVQ